MRARQSVALNHEGPLKWIQSSRHGTRICDAEAEEAAVRDGQPWLG
jgi:hypothetical protein